MRNVGTDLGGVKLTATSPLREPRLKARCKKCWDSLLQPRWEVVRMSSAPQEQYLVGQVVGKEKLEEVCGRSKERES